MFHDDRMRAGLFDPVHLESFLAIAQTRNFTEAGRRLGLQQSTVSQHIRKLEETVGRRLFVRDTHRVTLTADGEAMTGFAQTILSTIQRARHYFEGSQLRGRVRFGTSEDFVSTRLPELLRDFVRQHALVDLELKVGVSAALYDHMDAGELDLVLAKRRAGDDRGQLVWRDRLAWIGAPATQVEPPVPLILYNAPSITRAVALEALERAGLPWRIACTSGSLSGLRAACLAGLGVHRARQGPDPGGAGGGARVSAPTGAGRRGVRGPRRSKPTPRTGGSVGAGNPGERGSAAAVGIGGAAGSGLARHRAQSKARRSGRPVSKI
jgi:DNA-binding transcriptional LysR family regulator